MSNNGSSIQEQLLQEIKLRGLDSGSPQPSSPTEDMLNEIKLRGLDPNAYQSETPGQDSQPQDSSGIWPQIKSLAKSLPGKIEGAGKQVSPGLQDLFSPIGSARLFTNPSQSSADINKLYRAAKVALGGGLNLTQDIARKPNADIGNFLNSPQSKDVDYVQKLGVGQQQPGDTLLSSAMLSLAPEAIETKAMSAIPKLLSQTGEAGAYGMAGAPDKLEGAELGSALTGATNLPLALLRAGPLKNLMLAKARMSGEVSPSEALKKLEQNYTLPSGKRAPVDLGTISGDKMLSGLYGITSKVPFMGGKGALKKTRKVQQLSDLNDKYEERNQKIQDAHEDYQKNISPFEDIPSQDKIDELKAHNDQVGKHIERAPNFIDSLRVKGNPQERASLYKEAMNFLFDKKQQQSKGNYKQVDNFDVDLDKLSTPEDYKNFNLARDKVKTQSKDLKEMFGEDSDLASSIQGALRKSDSFFHKKIKSEESTINPATGKVTTKSSEVPKKITLKGALAHIRNLNELGSLANSSGQHATGSALFGLASSFKKDIKDVLNNNGYSHVSDALERADKFHQDEILPFYKNPVMHKAIKGSGPLADSTSYAKALFSQNAGKILDEMPENIQKGAIHELIANKKGTSGLKTNISPDKIGSTYRNNLDEGVKQKIFKISPEADSYLENLNNTIKSHEENKKLHDSYHKGIIKKNDYREQYKNKKQRADEVFQNHLKNAMKDKKSSTSSKEKLLRYIPAKSAIVGGASYIHPALGIGVGASMMGGSAYLNKALTNPELIDRYIHGGMYKGKDRVLIQKLAKRAAQAAPNYLNQNGDKK